MVCSPPKNRTRLPFDVDAAFASKHHPRFHQLFVVFTHRGEKFRLGITPASLFLSALTITMTRIWISS
jgi:hypothetical protein